VLPDTFRLKGNVPGSRDNANEAGKGGYGALFAVMVQILLRAGAIAVQI
jgi:hypothetical protein